MDDKNQFARKPLPYHRKLVKHCGYKFIYKVLVPWFKGKSYS